jgi:hypothetical protein
MGYSHYSYRPPVIADEVFQAIRRDFKRLILQLADIGLLEPVLHEKLIGIPAAAMSGTRRTG